MYLPNYKVSRAVPCLRRLFAGLSKRRPNFDPIWDLWWTKWHWGRFFLRVFCLSAVSIITQMLRVRISFLSLTHLCGMTPPRWPYTHCCTKLKYQIIEYVFLGSIKCLVAHYLLSCLRYPQMNEFSKVNCADVSVAPLRLTLYLTGHADLRNNSNPQTNLMYFPITKKRFSCSVLLHFCGIKCTVSILQKLKYIN